ncbi:MAG TPA: hypothetical protein DCS43_15330 [Verrucomicrobia bacterium]|nr:hypothetical protein [Verrucomicrobiota bacterium]
MSGKRERLVAFLNENRLIKLIALGLATASIYAIQRITSQLEEYSVPIQVQTEKGVAILRQDARTAYITCRGSLDDLKRIDVKQLSIMATPRVTGVAGTAQVPIGPRDVSGSLRGVTVIKVRPEIVNLAFDREIEKSISIAKPELVGKPLLGRAEVDYEPKIALVRGPKQLLTDLKILRTEPISIDGVADSFSRNIRVQTDIESGVWSVEPAEIAVRVNIVTEAVSKEWTNLSVLALRQTGTRLQFTFSPAVVNLSVLGSPQSISRIDQDGIRVFVDCSDIRQPGTYAMPAGVHLPDSLEVSTAVNPPVISITVEQRPGAAGEEPEAVVVKPPEAEAGKPAVDEDSSPR